MDNPSRITTLATVVRELLSAQDTPAPLRARLANFSSELRDTLAPDDQRRLDGLEAEAVITSFASLDAHAPPLTFPAGHHPAHHQTLDVQSAKSEDKS